MADNSTNRASAPGVPQLPLQEQQEQPDRAGEAGDKDNEYSYEAPHADGEDGIGQAGSPGNSAVGNGLNCDSDSEFPGSKLSASPDGTGHGGDSGIRSDFETRIREDMKVVDGESGHLGTVDRCEGGQIKLTKADSRDGEHRFIPLDRVEAVDSGTVTIRGSMDEPFRQNGS
jgi:hypothetical protein